MSAIPFGSTDRKIKQDKRHDVSVLRVENNVQAKQETIEPGMILSRRPGEKITQLFERTDSTGPK